MSTKVETPRYTFVYSVPEHDEKWVYVEATDKTRCRVRSFQRQPLRRMLRRDNARKLIAMLMMGADDEALFTALRSTGMYNLPHQERHKSNA